MSSAVNADDLHCFFDEKVAGLHAATADSPSALFSAAPLGCSLTAFRPLDVDDIITASRALPDKQFSSAPPSTSLLKDNIDVLAPFLVEFFNSSLKPVSFQRRSKQHT